MVAPSNLLKILIDHLFRFQPLMVHSVATRSLKKEKSVTVATIRMNVLRSAVTLVRFPTKIVVVIHMLRDVNEGLAPYAAQVRVHVATPTVDMSELRRNHRANLKQSAATSLSAMDKLRFAHHRDQKRISLLATMELR